MPNSPGRFRVAVGAGWAVLCVAAFVYARIKGIPAWSALPVAAAFLLEFLFYVLPAFHPERLRNPWLLAAACVLPWLVYSVPSGEFRAPAFALLLLIALGVSFWYRLLPPVPLADFGFLALLAGIYLSRAFDTIYLSPLAELRHRELPTLGHAMLIRAAATAVLAIRGGVAVEYRFLPTRREWLIGLRWALVLLPACGLALRALHAGELRPHPHGIALGLLDFVGIFGVVALSEEFFFRGLLQQWLESWTGSSLIALAVASMVFGAAHLGFHGIFPNWRFSLVAAVFGLCCGLAWRESRTIQAGMVTHAVGATLYRIFFV